MKKFFALIVSVIMAASVMTACGNSDSSSEISAAEPSSTASAAESTADESKAEESKAEESAAEESKAEESKAEESKTEESAAETESKADESTADTSNANWGPLGKAYTESLANGVYSLDMTVSTSIAGEMPVKMEVNGKNIHSVFTVMGSEVESYIIDGKAYNIMPAMKAYVVTDASEATNAMSGTSNYGLSVDQQLIDQGEEDGLKYEKYAVSYGAEGESIDEENSTVTTYYFDGDGNLKSLKSTAPVIGETTVTINSVSFDDVKIELPDLTGYTEMDQDAMANGEAADPKAVLEMTMNMLGITEDMVKKAGYTVDQLAEMDSEEFAPILVQIAKDNGLELSMLDGVFGEESKDAADE